MATHDITRHLLQPRKHYASVRMQQRRTITDADWNEGEQVRAETSRRTRVDLIGESGSPDFGYRVAPGTLLVLPDDTYDFALSPGTLYVGGNRLELFEAEDFRFQGDWLQQRTSDLPTVPAAARQDLVFVMAWQAVVTAAQDSELQEASLGPWVDASVRVRQFARALVREDVTGDDCDEAWADASAAFLADLCAGAELAADGEIVSPIRLTVAFDGETQTEDPCAPCVEGPTGGYLAAENQSIRVMVVGDGTQYTWGFDNASPLYRVRVTGTTVEILNPPNREELHPLTGQCVEILPWGALLDNGEKAAEPLGFFTRVDRTFDARDNTLEIETAPPPGTFVDSWTGHPHEDELPGPDGLYFFMRVWRRGTDRTSDPVLAIAGPGTPQALGNTGLTVEFSTAQGCPGDHWVIAARRNQPSRVVPWNLQDVTGSSPHGPRRFLAPLARIQWAVVGSATFQITDCRPRFRALTMLPSCCTFTVGAGLSKCSGHFATIQAAIDALPPHGGTICVLPGSYAEHVHIDGRVDVRLHGCGRRTRIVNPLGAQRVASASDRPLLRICNSQRITIEDLAIEADGVAGIRVVHGEDSGGGVPSEIDLRDLQVTVREAAIVGTLEHVQAHSAIELFGAQRVHIDGCELRMHAPLSVYPAVFLLGNTVSIRDCRVITTGAAADAQPWGGIQIPGGAHDITIADCHVTGGLGHGITLGSVNYAPVNAAGLPLLTEQASVPVGVAGIFADAGVGIVSSFAIPRAENGAMKIPIPGPLARRIRIVRNRIEGAATCGISAAVFWPSALGDAQYPTAIPISDLTIEDNVVSGNARAAPLGFNTLLASRTPGVGGVSLAAVANARIVGNRIVDNGVSFADPITGVYVLEGGAIEISGNTIADNGRRVGDPALVRRGRRGGLVVMRAVTTDADFITATAAMAGQLPAIPRPALIVRDNSIAQPEGKALYAPDLRGDAMVEGNALSSQGDSVPVADTLDEVQLEVAILPDGESVLDRRAGRGLGSVVYMRNNVRSIDAFATSFGAALGSRIGFNANQVVLDWVDTSAAGPQLCSVLIDALFDEAGTGGGDDGAGDVSIVGNQFQAIMHQSDDETVASDRARNVLLAQVVALGRSVRLTSNRIAEGRTDALISAFVWGAGLLPWASLNAATHCIVGGPVGATPFVIDNAILGPSGTSCTFTVANTAGRFWTLVET